MAKNTHTNTKNLEIQVVTRFINFNFYEIYSKFNYIINVLHCFDIFI